MMYCCETCNATFEKKAPATMGLPFWVACCPTGHVMRRVAPLRAFSFSFFYSTAILVILCMGPVAPFSKQLPSYDPFMTTQLWAARVTVGALTILGVIKLASGFLSLKRQHPSKLLASSAFSSAAGI